MRRALPLLRLIVAATALCQGQTAPPPPTPVRVADAPCAQCHREIYRLYIKTPMANASGMAAEKLIPGRLLHAPSQVDYTLAADTGHPTLSWRQLQDAHLSGAWPLDYFLGSGHLGITYLYTVDRYLLESPIAWYTDSQQYDMKPGLGSITELPPPLSAQAGCLRCHMSAVQASDLGTLNRYNGLPFLHGGTTCEACHGDTTAHIRSKGKAPVINPARLSADRRDSLCISCHLEGDVSIDRAGQSPLDFRPGDSISGYLAYYVYSGKDVTTRGVSEIEQLGQSMCKRVSGDRMSCTTCHDPHSTPPPQQQAAFFRSRCLICHNTGGFAASHHPENPDCINCHMPRNGARNIPHVAWTDHRILRHPDSTPPAGHVVSDTLTPIFSPDASSRDLAMAYYKALLGGNLAVAPKAWELLKQNQEQLADDKEALDALGILTAERGQQQDAARIFRRVLKLDPKDLTANSDLGILLAKQGDFRGAEALLSPTYSRNQDVAGLAMNLARVQCVQGDADAARMTLQTILRFDPALKNARQMLQTLASCRAPSP